MAEGNAPLGGPRLVERRSELPATLRRGDVDLDTVRIAELEEPWRLRLLGTVYLDTAFLECGYYRARVLDGHADVVRAHGSVGPLGALDIRVGLQQRVVDLAI